MALDLPDRVSAAIAAWQAGAVGGREGLRAVGRGSLHVTLAFLGSRPEPDIEPLAGLLAAVEPRPVQLAFEREPVPVPRRRPNLFALSCPSEEAGALQAELASGLQSAGLYEPERRAFWPHVTVFRARRRAGRIRAPEPAPAGLTEPFGAVRVALYRSNLRPQGASYSRLAAIQLPQPSGQKR